MMTHAKATFLCAAVLLAGCVPTVDDRVSLDDRVGITPVPRSTPTIAPPAMGPMPGATSAPI
jgi:hypothetical protein